MQNKKAKNNEKKIGTPKNDQSLMDTIKDTVLFPIHPEGWRFIVIFAVITAVLGFIDESLLFLGLVLTGWCVFFFRNPRRMTPVREGLVISPAYGKVCDIVYDVEAPKELDELHKDGATYTKVSIFLSVFDVHVNRIPMSGKIIQKVYRPGKFVNAATDKASSDNEMAGLVIQSFPSTDKPSVTIGVCQIAGWVARRIVTTVEENDEVKTGQELGIIRFGSRADIYLPKGIAPQVIIGQRTVEGETVIADFQSIEEPRLGEIRGDG